MTAPVPSRPAVARWYRVPLERLEAHIPLPRLSPSVYTAASLVLSLAAFIAPDGWALAAVVALVLVADWLDGATARRYGLTGPAGYLTDVLADRASEGLIFVAAGGTPLGQVFVLLWLVNCVLTMMSLRGGRHLALPLRFLYLVVVVLRAILR